MTDKLISKIVGARHMGEPVGRAVMCLKMDAPVILAREPQNPYDASAVRCMDLTGRPLGYLTRDAAAVVAKWMDEGWLVQARCVKETGPFKRRGKVVWMTYPDAEVWREQGRGRVRFRYAPPLRTPGRLDAPGPQVPARRPPKVPAL